MLVQHTISKLFYRLAETPKGVYLSCMDGRVPSGQLIGGTTFAEALKLHPVLIEAKALDISLQM